jgi:hypothetical protein
MISIFFCCRAIACSASFNFCLLYLIAASSSAYETGGNELISGMGLGWGIGVNGRLSFSIDSCSCFFFAWRRLRSSARFERVCPALTLSTGLTFRSWGLFRVSSILILLGSRRFFLVSGVAGRGGKGVVTEAKAMFSVSRLLLTGLKQ